MPGEKPSLEKPKEVFEDDEQFITLLNEGNGRAISDQRQAYSGKYSLRVTPDQRFNTKLPNLGVKIRDNSGAGTSSGICVLPGRRPRGIRFVCNWPMTASLGRCQEPAARERSFAITPVAATNPSVPRRTFPENPR